MVTEAKIQISYFSILSNGSVPFLYFTKSEKNVLTCVFYFTVHSDDVFTNDIIMLHSLLQCVLFTTEVM